MPTKKTVHFAEVNESYSPPQTPSPTFSSRTLSTPGPATPPAPPTSPQLHSTYIYAPFVAGNEPKHIPLTIHPALSSPLGINLSDPRTISPQAPLLSSRILSENATAPPMATFTLICEHLPWRMTIRPASPKPGATVTVSDVLHGLYSALRIYVQAAEYKTETLKSQDAISAAYFRRCSLFGPRAKEEENKGVRRIDFLLGKHRLLGFSPAMDPVALGSNSRYEEPVWRLLVAA